VTAIAIALVALLAAAGCRNEAAGPSTSDYAAAKEKQIAKRAKEGGQQPVAQPAARPQAQAPAQAAAPAVPATPVAMPDGNVRLTASEYTYDPDDENKRDPFRSFVLDQAREHAEQDIGPLEQFDISQLTVVAVVWDTQIPRALVADPSGRPYIVAEGASMGKNEGRVIQIQDDLVLVKETYVDWLGERTTKDIEMRLHREGKGGILR
jgi:type IV pilus assembly protein PilP